MHCLTQFNNLTLPNWVVILLAFIDFVNFCIPGISQNYLINEKFFVIQQILRKSLVFPSFNINFRKHEFPYFSVVQWNISA